MPYGGSPVEGEMPDEWKEKIMHATLSVGGMDLMAADQPPEHYQEPQGTHVSLQVDEVEAFGLGNDAALFDPPAGCSLVTTVDCVIAPHA